MAFELPPLPFAPNALEPHMSARTFEFHYGKHHKAYVDMLNTLVPGTPFEKMSLEDIIKATHGDDKNAKIYNNAAQIWNHTFFWNSMKPQGGGAPSGDVAKLIAKAFGELGTFKTKFKEAGMTQFGSGWAWLVLNKHGELEIVKTANAICPIAMGMKPIVTCDVWEHAYYIDYQNRRPDMLQAFLDNLVSWDFATKNLG